MRAVVLLCVVVLGIALVVLAYQATRTVTALDRARGQAEVLRKQLVAGDEPGVRDSIARIQDSTRTAHQHTDGVLWSIGARVPWLGNNLAAVETVSRVLDDLSQTTLPPSVDLAQAVSEGRFRPVNGRFDLEGIEKLGPNVRQASTAAAEQDAALQTIDAGALLPKLDQVVTDVQDKVHTVASAARAGSDAVRLLPTMLGQDGPRRYLLVVQNNAEIRATGGLPGSVSVLTARDGRLSMGFQGDATVGNGATEPVLPLTKGERAVYGDTLGTDFRDTNLTPDFPRAAQLMKAMISRNQQLDVDGVVAVDPIALAGVLRATGPVKVGTETLTADNVVPRMLNGAYQRFTDPQRQDDFFATTARGIFEALVSGQGDQQLAVRGLARAASEHRLLVWSGHRAEQEILRQGVLSGAVPGRTGSSAHVGMYLNDATGAKMQYYLRYKAGLVARKCAPKGVQHLDATMQLESTAPANVRRLSKWVTGFGEHVPLGSMRMNLRIYAPLGGEVERVSVDGRQITVTADEVGGRQVAVVPVLLRPGQRASVSASIRTPAGQSGDPVLDFTPGMESATNGVHVRSACA